jgi:hypothetical protein
MIDILLHQSGHIMLSDFDLSKQSGEPGGAPATIKQGGPNGVSHVPSFISIYTLASIFQLQSLIGLQIFRW